MQVHCPTFTMSMQAKLATRVSNVCTALREVRPRTEQEWMDEVIRHSNPEQEMTAWEITASAYTAFFDARTPTPKAKDQALRVLLDCRAGHSEKDIHKEAYKALSIAEIKSLIEHYQIAELTILTIMKLKNAR